MANSTTNLDLIQSSQAQKEVTANALFDASSPAMLFGRRSSTTAALTWGYYGGTMPISGVVTSVPNGTVTLTANATNYVEVDASGVVSANTTAFTSGSTRLYTVVTGASSVTSYTDWRMTGGVGTEVAGTAAALMAAHEADSDPHPGYAMEPDLVTVTWAASITVDMSTHPSNSIFRCTLTDATAVDISGAVEGQKAIIELIQDATGGRTVTLSSAFKFGTDISSYTATTTASKRDYIGVLYSGGQYRVIAISKGY